MSSNDGYEEYDFKTPSSSIIDSMYEYRFSLGLFLLGLIFTGAGVFFIKSPIATESDIEIVELDEQVHNEIVVEISGAVNNPGVYKLSAGNRVEDLIVTAGGLRDNHDKEFIEKIINRAAKLSDGQKIYIPEAGKQLGTQSDNQIIGGDGFSGQPGAFADGFDNTQTKHVNINNASKSELESLWGIGPVTAQNIVEQRPYSNIDELLERKILKSNVFERNKDFLTIY